MTRAEFIDVLQRTLAGSLGSSYVNENIRYYQEYIDTQIRQGHSEAEIIAQLGDPRLIAKSIIEAAKQDQTRYGSVEPDYEEVYEDGGQTEKKNAGQSHVYRMPGWVLAVLIIVFIVAIVGIVGSVVSMLLPVMIPIICILFIVRFFQRRS